VSIKSIVAPDIEHFGRRKGAELAAVRGALFNLLHGALEESDIAPAQTRLIDSGDGGFVLRPRGWRGWRRCTTSIASRLSRSAISQPAPTISREDD